MAQETGGRKPEIRRKIYAAVTVVLALLFATTAGPVLAHPHEDARYTSGSSYPSQAPNGQEVSRADAPQSGAVSIYIGNDGYSPQTLYVTPGTLVTWRNNDSDSHRIVSDSTADRSSWDTGNLQPGSTWSYGFDEPGTYTFHCNYDRSATGTVVVVAGGGERGGYTGQQPAPVRDDAYRKPTDQTESTVIVYESPQPQASVRRVKSDAVWSDSAPRRDEFKNIVIMIMDVPEDLYRQILASLPEISEN